MSAKSLTLVSNGSGARESQEVGKSILKGTLPSKPFLWIRTLAGPFIGFGHLRRALVLAQALNDLTTPIFLVDPLDIWTQEAAQRRGWRFAFFKLDELWSSLPNPAAVLIDTRDPSGLEALISESRELNIPCISIQDLGLNSLPSDIIIDGSISPCLRNDLRFKSKSYTGASYMVLETAYCFLHCQCKRIREKIQSVVINLGGGDSRRYFPTVLEGLMLWKRNLEVIGIPGFTSWGQTDLAARDWKPLNFRWAAAQESIPKILFCADLAITAGGLSAFESLCVGTPLMALSYDHFQQITISALMKVKSCLDLGRGDSLRPMHLADLLRVIGDNQQERKNLSTRGKQIVDGRGAERVVRIIRRAIRTSSKSSCLEASS
jgi:spore coat polysaccharide biosynthesis predicted glycosyltransferase SpsG